MLQKQIIIFAKLRIFHCAQKTRLPMAYSIPDSPAEHLGEEYLTVAEFFLSDFSDIIRKAQMTCLFEKSCSFPLCWHICSRPSHYICVRDLLHLC